jgi:hypothetical protein
MKGSGRRRPILAATVFCDPKLIDGSMVLRKNIAVRALVWLIALLVPAEAMPMPGCGCGGKPSQQLPVSRKCCGKSAKGCCCSAKAKAAGNCCCCRKGARNSAGNCQCAKNDSAPVQAPGQSQSPTDSVKLLASTAMPWAVDLPVPAAVRPPTIGQPSFADQTSLERLSSLCRLVV